MLPALAWCQVSLNGQTLIHPTHPSRLPSPPRHVQVKRGIKSKQISMIIIAPNIESGGAAGSLDDKVLEILRIAKDLSCMVVWALNRRKLGKALNKSVRVSVVGVQSVDGANQLHKQLVKRMAQVEMEYVAARKAGDD